MSYKIVVDSCCELPEKYKKDPHFEIVPLGLEVGDYRIMDDEHFNQKEFLEQVVPSARVPPVRRRRAIGRRLNRRQSIFMW